jgi:hypothetical protein
MSGPRIAQVPPMSTYRIPALSVRLARLAAEADELAQQIIAEPLGERDELFLAAPTAQLAIALEWLKQALYECDRLDLTQSWARWLREARKEPDDAHAQGQRDSPPGVPRQPGRAPKDVLATLAA